MSAYFDTPGEHRVDSGYGRPAGVPATGEVNVGDLQRTRPISEVFGFDRGICIDRYYIERFLDRHRADVRGRVLETGDDRYTQMFGDDRVTSGDVLHVVEGNCRATIVDDLTSPHHLREASFDCVILTQTLQHIFDVRSAVFHLHRLLSPGGVALVTVPGISQINRADMDRWGDYWRFTTDSLRLLFGESFGRASVTVGSFGNVAAATSFLHGLAVEDVGSEVLDAVDEDYQLLLTVRAIRNEE